MLLLAEIDNIIQVKNIITYFVNLSILVPTDKYNSLNENPENIRVEKLRKWHQSMKFCMTKYTACSPPGDKMRKDGVKKYLQSKGGIILLMTDSCTMERNF